MISETAKIDADYLLERGVKLTPEEILTLNELACAVEKAGTEHDSPANARRFVDLGGRVALEPSVQGASWLADAMAFYRPESMLDMFLVRFAAYLLDPSDLPKLQDSETVAKTIREKVFPVIRSLTFRQCYLICSYLSRWTDDGSDAAAEAGDDDGRNCAGVEIERKNYALGMMIQSRVYGLNFTLEDFAKMTATQLYSALRRFRALNRDKLGREDFNREKIAYDQYFEKLESRAVTDGVGQH